MAAPPPPPSQQNFFAQNDTINDMRMESFGGGPNHGQTSFFIPSGGPAEAPGKRFSIAAQHQLPGPGQPPTPLQAVNTSVIPDGLHEFHPTDESTWPAPGSVPGTLSVPPGAQQASTPFSQVTSAMQNMNNFSYMGAGIHADTFVGVNINLPHAPYLGKFQEGEPLFLRKGYGGGLINGYTVEKAVSLQVLNYILAQQSTEEYQAWLNRMEMEEDGDMEFEDRDLMEEWKFIGFFMSTTGESRRGQTVSTNGWGNTDATNIWANETIRVMDALGFIGAYFSRSIITHGRFYLDPDSNSAHELPDMPPKIYQLRPFVVKQGIIPDFSAARTEDSSGRMRRSTWIHVADSQTHMNAKFSGMHTVFFDARKKHNAEPFKSQSSINTNRVTL